MNAGDLLPTCPPSLNVLKLFLLKLHGDINANDCVLWTGESRSYKGRPAYPTFRLRLKNGKRIMVRARNLSYCWLLQRSVCVGERLKTICENDACVNPHHVIQKKEEDRLSVIISDARNEPHRIDLISTRKNKAISHKLNLPGGVHKTRTSRHKKKNLVTD